MKLSAEVRSLCKLLTFKEGNQTVNVCQELNNILQTPQEKDEFVLWLLKVWSFSSNIKNHQSFNCVTGSGVGAGPLNVRDICKIVKEMELEKQFLKVTWTTISERNLFADINLLSKFYLFLIRV